MRIGINYCKNCGAEYNVQYSGNYNAIEVPREYQDKDYCPDCKKAIVEALAVIPKKTEIRWIKTDEVDLKQVLAVEKLVLEKRLADHIKEHALLPMCTRVFAHLTNFETGEHSKDGEVEINNQLYRYHYWQSNPAEAMIRVKARIDLATEKIIAYY